MKRKLLLPPRPGASGWYNCGFLLLDGMAAVGVVLAFILPSVFMMQETVRIYSRANTWQQAASIARNEMEYQRMKKDGTEDTIRWVQGKPYYVHSEKSIWDSECMRYDVEVLDDGGKKIHCTRLGWENEP